MKRIILATLLAGSIATAHAGFDEAVIAYNAKNYALALDELQPLAEQGVAAAQYNVGMMHYNGQGVRQDYVQAVSWFNKAAKQGYAAAQYNLGLMYYNGKSIPQDYAQALSWFSKAAN